MKRKWIKRFSILSMLIVILFIGYRLRYDLIDAYRDWTGWTLEENPRPEGISTLEWAEMNYKDEMLELSEKFDLPYEYLMALLVLECGGEKPAGHRYEPGIMKKLEKVKSGTYKKFENIFPHHLEGCDDNCLENLATSWGPFQLMGYKAIPLGVSVSSLRDEEEAAEIGVKWIQQEYGHFLEKKKFKDAFHYHNTGDRFPLSGKSRTHNPYYVSDGIRYMKYFEKRKSKSS